MSKNYIFFVLVLCSINTNAQWSESYTGGDTNRIINNISVVDDNSVWVSDQFQKTFNITTDGGDTWITKNFPEELQFIGGLTSTSSTTAYVVTALSPKGIYKTDDSGDTWTKQNSGFNDNTSFPNFIYFFNDNDGVAVGEATPNEYFEIYTTNNGGNNWNLVADANMPNGNSEWTYNNRNFFKARGDNFYFTTSSGRIFKSADKGLTWSVINTPKSEGVNMSYDFKDDNNGLLSYADLPNETYELYSTQDGGATWTPLDASSKVSLISYSKYDNVYFSNHASFGLMYSTDDGQTWSTHQSLEFIGQGGTGRLELSNSGKIFIGGWGKVYSSTNYLGINPSVISATEIDNRSINITFSEDILNISAQDTSKFYIRYLKNGSYTKMNVSTSLLDNVDKTLVHITTNFDLPKGEYSINVKSLEATSGYKIISKSEGSYHIFNTAITNDLEISDTNFEQALIDLGYDTNGLNGTIFETDALLIDTLKISDPLNNPLLPNVNTKISSLTGIENFPNLVYLDANENSISNVDLSMNTELEYLVLGNNSISNINLTNNNKLKQLFLNDNQLTSIDFSNNLSLERLGVMRNNFSDIDITMLTMLQDLFLHENNFTSIDISKNTLLKSINISANQLTSISTTNNTELTRLYIYSNNISNININSLIKLERLYAGSNNLSNVDVSNNILLERLSINENNISSIDISMLTQLQSLWVYKTSLNFIDISNNNSLSELQINETNISQLDLKNNIVTTLNALNNPNLFCIQVNDVAWSETNLTNKDATTTYSNYCEDTWVVYTQDNNFEVAIVNATNENGDLIDADGDGNISIEEAKAVTGTLDLGNMNIDDLTGITAFENITGLIISGNNLTDISGLLNGTTTAVNKRGKKEFMMGGFSSLETLDVSDNSISDIDLSSITSLTNLNVSNNNLSSLNIKNGLNSILVTFDASENPSLSCIQVDDGIINSIPDTWTKDSNTQYKVNCDATLSTENILIDGFNIYPNPVNNILTVDLHNENKIINIYIYDIIGNIIKTSKHNKIEMYNLPSGIYIVKVTSDKGQFSKRIIKK